MSEARRTAVIVSLLSATWYHRRFQRSPRGMGDAASMDREFSSIHLQTIPGTGTIPSQVRRPVSGPPRRRLVTADNCIQSHPTRGSWLHPTGMQGPSPATCAPALPCKREDTPSTTPSSFLFDPIQHCFYPGCPQLRAWFRFRAPPASCCVPFKHFFWGLPAPLALSQSLHLIGEWTRICDRALYPPCFPQYVQYSLLGWFSP